jgi:TonB family protein
MLQVLVESRAARPRRASWTALSFVAHSALIVGAILLTARAVPETRPSDPNEGVVYVAPRPTPQSAASATRVDAAPSIVIPRTVLTIPAIIPPPIVAPTPDFFSRVLEDLTRTTVGTITGNPGVGVAPGEVHTAQTVDRVVAPLPGNASPIYPSRLSGVGVEGDVSVGFVVDTTGRVEASSIEILQASHALFGEAVKQWLKQTRYSPALANGRPVRQLVRQRVGFSLTR